MTIRFQFSNQGNTVFGRIMPFVTLGIFCVLLVIGLIFLSYVLLIGAALGVILFVVNFIYRKLKYRNQPPAPTRQGRTFDHEE